MFPPPEQGAYHILCIGDSLTEGYTKNGTAFWPYADTLQRLLAREMAKKEHSLPVVVYNEGVSGDRILGTGMKRRLESCIEEAADADVRFEWVIIMAGINDVGAPTVTAHDMYAALQKLLIMAARYSKKVLVMNCMEVAHEVYHPRMTEVLSEYNAMVETSTAEVPGVFFLDMRKKMPYHSLLPEERGVFFDDGVHLTKEGYERMGEIISHKMMSIGLD
jgi:lysophospholipase L1-like esterase